MLLKSLMIDERNMKGLKCSSPWCLKGLSNLITFGEVYIQ